MIVYLYKDENGQARGSLFFLRDAIRRYCGESDGAGFKVVGCGRLPETGATDGPENIPDPGAGLTVYKNDKGQPVVEGGKLFVSASHTGGWVACAVSDSPVGIDIQEERKIDGLRVVKRFGTPEERALVEAEGNEAFFEIWCRKEAYAKFVGEGLSYGLGNIQTCVRTEGDDAGVRLADDICSVPVRSGRLEEDRKVFFAIVKSEK